MMLTASQTLTRRHQADLELEAQRLVLTASEMFNYPPTLLLEAWAERGGALKGAFEVSTRRTVELSAAHLADQVGELTGFRPPAADMVTDPAAYLTRVGGLRDFDAFVRTVPRRVTARTHDGMDLTTSIAQEMRTFQGIAKGDPFRTWRKLTEDVTTNTDPLWRGWVRIPEPGACAFCRTMASRGAVYRKNTGNFRSHERCKCAARAVVNDHAARIIGLDGEAAWAEMQATGDVPRLPRDRRRRAYP